ncbi:MAG TPA: phosphonate metabolism protein/1,5-bisphosphokinase (PRPP-forming) PhnN [Xanthobacteraceae bacterium]|nr:phosphonate metabolism protein/1,5-bisphosphokinase (PRPP-forming) PhnN [Xanthobacteraceae bacterium]
MPEMQGRLVHVMGPSGAGKDTLLDYARARVDPAAVIFAHRFITRPAESSGENHITLSEPEFLARRESGLFALTWHSHGFWYGISAEIDLWLERGFAVVVSGSRAAWPLAKARYPNLLGLMIDAPAEIRAARLMARGREDERAIRARLDRDVSLPLEGLHLLCNDGPIAVAGEALVKFLHEAAARPSI